MNIGLRAILLLAAVVVFVVAIFVERVNALKWMAAGLALFAAAFFVSEGGVGRRLGRRRL